MRLPEPSGHRIIIRPDKVEEISKGGIIKPQSTVSLEQRAGTKGTVIAIGKDAFFDKKSIWATPGDRILFSQYASVRFEVEDDEYWIINDEDVLANYSRSIEIEPSIEKYLEKANAR